MSVTITSDSHQDTAFLPQLSLQVRVLCRAGLMLAGRGALHEGGQKCYTSTLMRNHHLG